MSAASAGWRLASRLVSLVLLGALAACSGNKPDAIPAGSKVLVIGDSITAGYGLNPEQSWTAHLAGETGWRVINAGVSGDTSSGGLTRLPALLDEHQPAVVIVELGGNDMLRRQSPASIAANIESMLAEIRRRGARPILMATPQPSLAGVFFSSLSDAPFYAEIARKQKLPLIEGVLSSTLSRQEFKLDELHPNQEGHQRISKEVVISLRKQGLVR